MAQLTVSIQRNGFISGVIRGRSPEKLPLYNGKNFLFASFHDPGVLGGAPFMVVSQEVQGAVQEQKIKLAFETGACLMGVTGCGLRGDDNVAEDFGMNVTPLPLAHGEGDHVGRVVVPEIVAVDPVNLLVIDEQDRQLGVRTSRDA